MGADPHVIGMILGDRNQYGGPLHATPDHDQGERPRYAPDDLWQFKIGADNSACFNLTLDFIHDLSLTAEVTHFWETSRLFTQYLSRTKVLVRDGPIQSHLVTRETSAGHVPLVSLQIRAGRTVGNSRGHSLVQSPECGNEFNQAWESCTTTG